MSFFEEQINNTQKEENAAQRLFWEKAKLPKKRRGFLPVTACVVIALVCVSAAAVIALNFVLGKGWLKNALSNDSGVTLTLKAQPKPTVSDEFKTDDGRYTVEGVAQAAGDAVVSITCYKENEDENASFTYAGQGSGVIFTADGYIITNAHVISAATKGMSVTLSDGRDYEGKLIGSDEASDIAVIKIAGEFTPIEIGDSSEVNLGEQVVAIGNPGGYGGTVTSGIVSGTDRLVRGGNSGIKMSCLQVDAAINPGSSGGALLNMWGQLIGITSSKLASTDYDGIGFAISSNAVIPVVEQIVANGYVKDRPKVGITYYAVSEAQAKIYGNHAGLYVQSVEDGVDAANYLKPGDIITEIDGQRVDDSAAVTKILETKKAGDTLKIKYLRPDKDGNTGDEQTATVKLMSDVSSEFEESKEQ